jgi:hypothetical protein
VEGIGAKWCAPKQRCWKDEETGDRSRSVIV